MTNPIAALGPADFAAANARLQPPGVLLPRDPAAVFSGLLAGLSGRMAAVHAAAGVLSETESDPRQTVLLLAGWEKSFGLPDQCLGQSPTLPQRRAQLVARIAGRGGQNAGYFVSYAANLGYAVSVTTFRPLRFGVGKFGQKMLPVQAQLVWQVNVPSVTLQPARFGQNSFGDRYQTASNSVLVCELNRIKPAHTMLLFAYS
jgi:uncharacterized protein YmfQ (DUF2313 family)